MLHLAGLIVGGVIASIFILGFAWFGSGTGFDNPRKGKLR